MSPHRVLVILGTMLLLFCDRAVLNYMYETNHLSAYIIHVDIDCFYCQVEQLRLGLSFETPFVVEQWGSILAVNYAAREFGVQRMMTLKQAQRLCPVLHSAHTATLALEATEPHKNPTKMTHKVSLEPYRIASERIHSIFRRVAGLDCVYERGSSDEAFIDITFRVMSELNTTEHGSSGIDQDDDISAHDDNYWPLKYGVLLKNTNSDDLFGWKIAARICCEMRSALKAELGYSCSAGISSSKILSKLLSAKYKPNMQATVLSSGIEDFMRNIPIKDVPGFGGIFGDKVTQFLRIELCGELWNIAESDLLQKFDLPTIDYIINASKGEDCEEVIKERPQSKSILAAKNFSPTKDIMQWIHTLVAELHDRLKNFISTNSTTPESSSELYEMRVLSYPQTITLELKWIEVDRDTDVSHEIPESAPKSFARSFPFHVPPKYFLDSTYQGSQMKLLHNVLSYTDLLMKNMNLRRFTSLSIRAHAMQEYLLSSENDLIERWESVSVGKTTEAAEESTNSIFSDEDPENLLKMKDEMFRFD